VPNPEGVAGAVAAPGEVTRLLIAWSGRDPAALERLIPLAYPELRRLAARYLRRERSGGPLQSTAIVHEAYLKLVDQRNVRWQNRAHFFPRLKRSAAPSLAAEPTRFAAALPATSRDREPLWLFADKTVRFADKRANLLSNLRNGAGFDPRFPLQPKAHDSEPRAS
jgi:hypothetical protein